MKVLLIDDHPLILAALQSVIQGLGDHVEVAAASSGKAARECLQNDAHIDLILLDLKLGDVDGFDLLSEFRSLYPAVPVVVISASDRTSDVIRSIDMGAMGFVPKRASNETLVDALQQVVSGGVYVPPMSMGSDVIGNSSDGGVQQHAIGDDFQTAPPLSRLNFTPRQTDVLTLLLKGQPNKMIARDLGLSVDTVKDHVASVLRILGVNSRTQAVIAVSQILQNKGGVPAGRRRRRQAPTTTHF